MNITFTGTGTSQGVPMIGCKCAVCTSTDKRDNRLRSAVWLTVNGKSLVIDCGPDFRFQMLRAGVSTLDAILITHSHKDHIAGLDDVRAYNYFQQRAMEVFATEETQDALRREFAYIFNNAGYPGIPKISLNTITDKPFSFDGIPFIPIPVLHYKMNVLGFRIGDFTYITDANFLSPKSIELCLGSKVLVLNALRHEPHISHFTLPEAVELAKEIGAGETYFTHISHQLGLHEEVSSQLPPNIHLAYDGLSLTI